MILRREKYHDQETHQQFGKWTKNNILKPNLDFKNVFNVREENDCNWKVPEREQDFANYPYDNISWN